MDGLKDLRIQPRQIARRLQGVVAPPQSVPLRMPKANGYPPKNRILRQRRQPTVQQRGKLIAVGAAPRKEFNNLNFALGLLALRYIQDHVVMARDDTGLTQARQ